MQQQLAQLSRPSDVFCSLYLGVCLIFSPRWWCTRVPICRLSSLWHAEKDDDDDRVVVSYYFYRTRWCECPIISRPPDFDIISCMMMLQHCFAAGFIQQWWTENNTIRSTKTIAYCYNTRPIIDKSRPSRSLLLSNVHDVSIIRYSRE